MLTHIFIKNFTIVDCLELDLAKGLTVITGETGAGKSIWIDAVNLALGERADSSVVSTGATCCEISLCFDLKNNEQARRWLAAQQIPEDAECILRRLIYADGRSRSTINGTPIAQNLIRQFCQFIISIHSQHQHHTLGKAEQQRLLLDSYGQLQSATTDIQMLYQEWSEIKQTIAELKQRAEHKDLRVQWLHYQLEELRTLDPKPGEWQRLNQEYQTLHQSQQLIELLQDSLALLEHAGPKPISAGIQTLLQNVQKIAKINPQLQNCLQLVENAQIHLDEACTELTAFYQKWDFSPEKIEALDQRLSQIHDLARKHKVTPQELPKLMSQLLEEWNQLQDYDEHLQALLQKQSELERRYDALARVHSAARLKAAAELSQKVTEQMQHLGMQGGEFCVELLAVEDQDLHPYGNERISFSVCTNPGHGLHPLHKIASGGELSRINLSLQVITARKEGIPILIFDEVDSGLGGKTADIVGALLQNLAQYTQVICITHLPQVACKAHQHFMVNKRTETNSTHTEIKALNMKERILEIARMLGGQKITKQTLAHAEEMLSP